MNQIYRPNFQYFGHIASQNRFKSNRASNTEEHT